MPDEPTPWELQRRLEAQERACERRADGHLDINLYISERDAIVKANRTLERTMSDLRHALDKERAEREAEAKAFRDEQKQTRRWLLATLVFPVIVGLIVLLVGRLL